jgi:hypothetical protein
MNPPGFALRGPPGRRYSDPFGQTILEMMQRDSELEYQHAMQLAAQAGEGWRTAGNIAGSVYPAYQDLQVRRREEEDRELAQEDRLRGIERTERLDLIADEERAQAQRDLAYEVGRQRITDLSGLDEDVVAASLGDRLQTTLPGLPSSTDPLYLPDMPLTDPEKEERVGPRLLTSAQALPQGKPLAHLAEISSRIEGETERIPVPTRQEGDRDRYIADQEKRSFERFRAGLTTEERVALEKELITTVRVINSSGGEDVIFIDQTVLGKTDGTLEKAELGRIIGSPPPETRLVPTQTSMINQADAGLARVLAGQDPGEFAFDRLRDRTKDPLHLDALSEGFRSRESRVYKNYLSIRLADNPAMAALNPRSPRGAGLLPQLKLDEFEEWEGQVFNDFLEGVERYLQGPSVTDVPLFVTDPKTGESYPVPADMAVSPGDVIRVPHLTQDVTVHTRDSLPSPSAFDPTPYVYPESERDSSAEQAPWTSESAFEKIRYQPLRPLEATTLREMIADREKIPAHWPPNPTQNIPARRSPRYDAEARPSHWHPAF